MFQDYTLDKWPQQRRIYRFIKWDDVKKNKTSECTQDCKDAKINTEKNLCKSENNFVGASSSFLLQDKGCEM